MAELLIKTTDNTHADPVKDRRGCYKRGYPVVVMPDGHGWGNEERLPWFWIVKLPMIDPALIKEYIAEWRDTGNLEQTLQRRRWQLQVEQLPAAALDILTTTGVLTVKVHPAYDGPFDLLWTDFRQRWLNLETLQSETRTF